MKMSKVVSAAAITALAAVACMTVGTTEASAKKAENVILDETKVYIDSAGQRMQLEFEIGTPNVAWNGYPETGVSEFRGGEICKGNYSWYRVI